MIPAFVWVPFMAAGTFVILRTGLVMGLGLIMLIAAQVVAWITLNWTGLFENRNMRKALCKDLEVLKPHFRGFRAFVGFASPSHSSMLDAHEDVGFLLLTPETLEFIGDTRTIVVLHSQVFGVHFKANVHTLVGLGRWICIVGRIDGKPFEMRIEPRDRDTLLGNLLLGQDLKERVENWLKRSEPQA